MPIYEYRCEACGFEKEALQKISDEPLKDCPECHKPALKKKVSAPGFRLSGSGWYETDFKTGSKKNLSGDAGKAAANGGTSNGSASNDSGNNSGANKSDAGKADKKASAGD